MIEVSDRELIERVERFFADRGLETISVTVRAFPNETIVIVEMESIFAEEAIKVTSEVESELPPGFLVVIRKADARVSVKKASVTSVNDNRVSRLIELLNERSRTSEQQPSLQYIVDAAQNLRVALTKRHHLIFGRRGVGKTALLLEAKRQIEKSGAMHLWINVQVLRGLGAQRAFLTIAQRLCELPAIVHRGRIPSPESVARAKALDSTVSTLLTKSTIPSGQVAAIVPAVQQLVGLLCAERANDLFLFVDELHYLEAREQPLFLDFLHGVTRDNAAWLKIAGIRNQCRVYYDNPPTGLQLGHDAAEIPLDVTLEEPRKARKFLISVLQTYLNAAGIANRAVFLSSGAVDRLVLASGGVPRDFLVLSARSVQIARLRDNARVVGVQDVNEAAGEAGKQKKAELEEDAEASSGQAATHLRALEVLREFTIDQNHCSFFRVNLRDKNNRPDEYALLQSLMDLRMVHLVKGSLSEAHAAGERSEVYMIDLSEYSSSRLKKNLNVIELRGDMLVSRTTGQDGRTIVADTARKVVQIFRTGPLLDLGMLTPLLPSMPKKLAQGQASFAFQ
jgi:hypothetical protein